MAEKPRNRFRGKDKAIASLVCGIICLLLMQISSSAGFASAAMAQILTSPSSDEKGSLEPVRDRDGNITVDPIAPVRPTIQSAAETALDSRLFEYAALFLTPVIAIVGIVLAKKSLNSGGRGKIRTIGLTLSVLGALFGFTMLLSMLFWMDQDRSRNLILADEFSQFIFSWMG